jgi:hypothetical protein
MLISLLSAAGVIALIVALASQLQVGTGTCVPADFPRYPDAPVAIELSSTGTASNCFMVLHTKDSQLTAVEFYQSHLGAGDWKVISVSTATGTVRFERASRPQTTGSVSFVAHPRTTNIYIRVRGR